MDSHTLNFHCPHCHCALTTTREFAGQTHACPDCRNAVTSPDWNRNAPPANPPDEHGSSKPSRQDVTVARAAPSHPRKTDARIAATPPLPSTTTSAAGSETQTKLPAPRQFDAPATAAADEQARKSLNPNLLPRLAEREDIDYFNPELRDWQRARSELAFPGWLIPMAASAILLVIVALVAFFRKAPQAETTALQPPSLTSTWRDRCESTVHNFLKAGTIEDQLRWVRHPEQTRPRLIDYITRGDSEPWELDSFREKTTASTMDDAEFLLIDVKLTHGITRTAALELTPSGPLLDWESFVLYEPMPWLEFIAERPAKAHVFRVHCKEDDYYNFAYSNADTHLCLRLDSPNRTQEIYGYLPHDSDTARAIQRLLNLSTEAGKEWTKLTLQLRFGPDSGAQQVAVETLVSEFWVFDADHGAQAPDPDPR